jgi:adenylate cyclase
MTEQTDRDTMVENLWRTYLTTGKFEKERRQRHFFRLLPGSPRCKSCYAPFEGIGSLIVKLAYGKKPSNLNPRLCNACEQFASEHQGGTEIELSLLFADVRGSTNLAEGMSSLEYSKLINRFYSAATQVMVESDALIDKIIGDQVAAMYVPGFAGSNHAGRAIEAAREVLQVTGHVRAEEPWIPIGIGVHTGTAFVGSVRSQEGVSDITVLGDAANTTARLASSALTGEILVSEAACSASKMDLGQNERRTLQLKGKSQPMSVHVLTSF